MVGYVFGLLALVLVVLLWFDKEFSVRAKIVVTVVYLLTWCANLVIPFGTLISQAIFSLALYFLMYPSGFGGR